MFRNKCSKMINRKNESVEDPHELILSLVDLGSIDCEEALLACVHEMSDSECKRVLGSLTLPSEELVEDDLLDDTPVFPSDEDDEDDEDDEEDKEDKEEDPDIELESRICKLENAIKRNRINKAHKI